MENDNYLNNKTQCGACGRPFPKAEPCKNTCSFRICEYPHKAKGCIRNKNPECPYNAVIASVTVETIDGISNLADCFVHVTSINTTFYIDDKHRIMTIWAGPVELTIPEDVTTSDELVAYINSLGLRSQSLYLKTGDVVLAFYIDKNGTAYTVGEFSPANNEGGEGDIH